MLVGLTLSLWIGTLLTAGGETQMLDYGGIRKDFKVGENAAFIVLPKDADTRKQIPWVWYAPTLMGRHPDESHEWLFSRLLDAGFAIAGIDVGESYGNPEGRERYQAFVEYVVPTFSLAPKACLLPQSRGGLMLYNWAAEHPDRVQCIGGIYTVCDPSSWPGLETAAPAYHLTPEELKKQLALHNPLERLEPLAKCHIPILHVHGDSDTVVPLEKNSGELARRYRELGGDAQVVVIPGKGHQVCDEFFKNQSLLDFFLKHGIDNKQD